MTAYLDHNATTRLKPAVIDMMQGALALCANASSQHAAGRAAMGMIESARARVASLVNCPPQNVIFTSGATEANNMILQGHTGAVIVSAIEHASVLDVRPDAIVAPVTADGIVDLAALGTLIAQHKPQLVCVMAVNNETGVIQPLREIAALCKASGVMFHCDAVQAAGKIPLDFLATDCDFMALSAHKMGGPQGAGALVFRAKTPVPKLLRGGGQERRQRAGTENVAAIAGFGVAAELAASDLPRYAALSALRDAIEKTLLDTDAGVIIHGRNAPRVANTVNFSLPMADAQTMLMQFDLAGVCVSSGAACSSGTIKPSHVLQAMRVDESLASASIRVSLGWDSTQKDVDAFVAAWQTIKPR